MKIFFGRNITNGKKQAVLDCEELVVRTVPESYYEKLESKTEMEESEEKEEKLQNFRKGAVRFVYRIGLGAVAFISLSGLLSSIGEVEDFQLMLSSIKENLLVFLISAVFSALSLFGLYRLKKFERNEEEKRWEEKEDEIEKEDEKYFEEIYSILGVPSSAGKIEVITSDYKVKNGNIQLKPNIMTGFMNDEIRAFVEKKTLFLADLDKCYAISLSEGAKIKKVSESLILMFWNKEQDYNQGRFEQFGIKKTMSGNYVINEYYSLEINVCGQVYSLLFPPYELKKVMTLTGAKIEE